FFLGPKMSALAHYARHRPVCAFTGHPDVAPIVKDAEARHGLPEGLLGIILDMESSTQPHRISRAGALRIAQLSPATAARLGVRDSFDTAQAVEGSARCLSDLLVRYRSMRLAVAAYNAGPGNVSDHVPQNGETEVYVQRVVGAYERLQEAKAAEA